MEYCRPQLTKQKIENYLATMIAPVESLVDANPFFQESILMLKGRIYDHMRAGQDEDLLDALASLGRLTQAIKKLAEGGK